MVEDADGSASTNATGDAGVNDDSEGLAESGDDSEGLSDSGDDSEGLVDAGDELTSHGPSLQDDSSPVSAFTDWFLFDGDRLWAATLLTVSLFVALLLLEAIGILAFENDDSITRLAGGMIAGTFSLVTLVVSINQLILSREFVAAGEAETQFDGVESFRRDVAELSGVPVAPTAPARLVELLATVLDDRGTALEAAVETTDERVRTPVREYVEALEAGANHVETELENVGPGPFETLAATVGFDDGWHRYVGIYLRETHGEALPADAASALDDVLDGLRLFAIAQEHVKTTTLQRELTRFSQLTILTGVPAVIAAFLIGFLYADVTGATISPDLLPYVVSALVAIVFAPLALLAAYILRTATIARRTASTGPMLPTKDPQEGAVEVTADVDPSAGDD